MEKVLAIVFLIIFVLFAIPHLRRGEWIAPTAIAPYGWPLESTDPNLRPYLATPPEGYGWFRFDFWNIPPSPGRPVRRSDFRIVSY